MICEFSKAELIALDMAIMDRAIEVKTVLRTRYSPIARYNIDEQQARNLEEKAKELDGLHSKLKGLIEQAEEN